MESFVAKTSFKKLGTVQGWLALSIVAYVVAIAVFASQQESGAAIAAFLGSVVTGYLLYCMEPKKGGSTATVLKAGAVVAIICMAGTVIALFLQLLALFAVLPLLLASPLAGILAIVGTLVNCLALWLSWAIYGGAWMQITENHNGIGTGATMSATS